ncbi:MAG: hypothetical protein WKG07_05345 [Hymenobacter sp.]
MAEQPTQKASFTWYENTVTLLLAGVGGSIDAIGYPMFAGLFMGVYERQQHLAGAYCGQQHPGQGRALHFHHPCCFCRG